MSATKPFLGVIIAAMFVLVPAAMAQAPSVQGYSQPGGTIQQQVSPSTQPSQPAPTVTPVKAQKTTTPVAAVKSSNESGKLPFTGLDLALVIGAGGVLMLLGVGLRRLTGTGDVV
jgi:hypothetical protein